MEPFTRLLRSLAEQNTLEAFHTPQAPALTLALALALTLTLS